MFIKLAGLLCGLSISALAQNEFIYTVKMSGCIQEPHDRSQTGFRVKGEKGIYTALHGVVDCKAIRAKGQSDEYGSLQFTQVDIDKDVAVLRSSELDAKDTSGLAKGAHIQWDSLDEVFLFGHPYGINLLRTKLGVRKPAQRPLVDLLPDEIFETLRRRNSPNTQIEVLDVEGGNVLPGHSGAPVLDRENHLIAVADGGLQGGAAQISWCIPFDNIRLVSRTAPKVQTSIQELANQKVTSLFAFGQDYTDGETAGPSAESLTERYRSLSAQQDMLKQFFDRRKAEVERRNGSFRGDITFEISEAASQLSTAKRAMDQNQSDAASRALDAAEKSLQKLQAMR